MAGIIVSNLPTPVPVATLKKKIVTCDSDPHLVTFPLQASEVGHTPLSFVIGPCGQT